MMPDVLRYENPQLLLESFGPVLGLIVPLLIVDISLKAWAMWRAARMDKMVWFVAILVVNSLGMLPIIFLLLTQDEYAALYGSKKAKTPPAAKRGKSERSR